MEKINLTHLIIDKIDDNKHLENILIRFNQDGLPNLQCQQNDQNKFKLDESQIRLLLDHIKDYEKLTDRIKCLTLVHSSLNASIIKDDLRELIINDFVLKLQNLKLLKLQNLDLSIIKFFGLLKPLKNLESISLNNTNLRTLENLENLTKLHSINFNDNDIKLTSSNQLTNILINYKKVEICNNNYLFQEFQAFVSEEDTKQQKLHNSEENNSKLEFLDLSNNQINDNILKHIVQHYLDKQRNLKYINLSHNKLSDEALNDLSNIKFMKNNDQNYDDIAIILKGNLFTSRAFELIKIHNIQTFSISFQDPSHKQETQQLFDQDFKNVSLKHLDLSVQHIPSVDIQKFISIKIFQSLITLNISKLRLQQNAIQKLLSEILENKLNIENLDLSYNNVGFKGCKLLNIITKRYNKLKTLILDSSNIQCVGLTYLWLAFNDPDREDMILDKLSVRMNNINVQWAVRLNFKLCNPLRVKHLDMGQNLLGDKAAKEIQAYFLKNKHLETLDLSYNGMNRSGLRRIRELIRYNQTLKIINLAGNNDIQKHIEMCERRQRFSETQQKIIYF